MPLIMPSKGPAKKRAKVARNWYAPTPATIRDKDGKAITGLYGAGYGYARQLSDQVAAEGLLSKDHFSYEEDEYAALKGKNGRAVHAPDLPQGWNRAAPKAEPKCLIAHEGPCIDDPHPQPIGMARYNTR